MRTLVALLSFIAPAASTAQVSNTTLYCSYVTYSGKPYMALEIPVRGLDEFADFAVVNHINKDNVYQESIKQVPHGNGERYAFEVGQDKKTLNLRIFDKVIDEGSKYERWSSMLTGETNKKLVLVGDCYIQ